MTVADALHRAAEAIRALPDRDLLELALRAEGPGPAPAPLVPAAAPAPPTAALRQEVATSAPRPPDGPQSSGLSRHAQAVLTRLRASGEPMTKGALEEALSLSATTAHRALAELREAGLATVTMNGLAFWWSAKP
ncbi:MAG: MarR family transcriptional regulator [Kofleriaceae bacterium]|nr:MarR family transcriptional regulator [Kofleriaceae bacterium]